MLAFRRFPFLAAISIRMAGMNCRLVLMGVLGLPCVGLAAEEKGAESPAPIDFARDVAPIFEEHCLRCHNPENLKGDVSFATPQDLLEQDYLKPAKPAESYLIELVAGKEGTPPKMPKEGK